MDYTDQQLRGMIPELAPKPQTVHFSTGAVRDVKRSDAEGHSVYVTTAHVTIMTQGERDFVTRVATSEDKLKYGQQWAAYQASLQRSAPSPLMVLPTMDIATARTIKELGVETVEQLAACPVLAEVRIAQDSRIDEISATESGVSFEIGDEPALPSALPAYLSKWQKVAQHYMMLKTFAQTGEKPRVKLEAAA